MIEERQGFAFGNNHGSPQQSIPFSDIYSAFTSELEASSTTAGSASTTQDAAGTVVATPVTMVTTAIVAVPVSTEIVDTTIIRTSFVTVQLTTDILQTPSTTSDSSSQVPSPSSLPPIISNGQATSTSLPAVVTESTGSSASSQTSPTTTLPAIATQTLQSSKQPATTPSVTSMPANSTASVSNLHHKHAIIGGLSGAIAGLVLIGILICFCLRRRRPRDEEAEGAVSEKSPRPAIARHWSQWSQLTGRDLPRPLPIPPASRASSTPDFDSGLIRMSLDHWPRPFVHGEGFRESVGPSELRVTNPDLSRPTTPLPRTSTETTDSNFFRKQRTALAAYWARMDRSQANSVRSSPYRSAVVPAIAIDPALSTECVAPNAPTPSFRSYPSVSTLPVVQQQPPEDPFMTPIDERPREPEPITEARPRRPNIAPLAAAGRTLSHISSTLNPFRSKSNVAESIKTYSRNSFSTFSSAGDPFRLDRHSLRLENGGRSANELERPPPVYEGT